MITKNYDTVLITFANYTVLNPDKYVYQRVENQAKLDQGRNIWNLFSVYIWFQLPKIDFWKGDWDIGWISTQLWDFFNIS